MKSITKTSLFAIACAIGCGASPETSAPGGDASTIDAGASEASASDASFDASTTDVGAHDGAAPEAAPTDATSATYPSGPYGSNAGDIIASLDWQGYVVPEANVVANTTTFTTTSLAQLRLLPNKGYALVHVSDFY